jgi:hypothetical protein
MYSRLSRAVLAGVLLSSLPLCGQVHHVRHARFPSAPSNDPQLQIPTDQAQSCFAPEGSPSAEEQYQQFDTYPQPASKGYLCIAIPANRTFIIDYLFAEADYDQALPFGAEWYLNSVIGDYESMTGFVANRAGSMTANPHFVLSQPVHIAVTGGTRVTLLMHNYYVSASSSITETPGTASLLLIGHWEQ